MGAATGFAGCFTSPKSDESPKYHLEVTVQNDHDRAYDVRIVMTDGNDDSVFENAFSLKPGEGRGIVDDYPTGTYTLAVSLADRAALRSYWNTDRCDVLQVRMEIGSDGRVTNAVRCANRTSTT